MAAQATKWCAKCGDAPRQSHVAYRRLCWNAYQSEYRKRRYRTEPDYRRKIKRKIRERLYGISEERYTELWAQQGGVCAICLLEPEDGKGLGVDHDHETGGIRGLLCGNCNGAIGMLKERPSLILRAADYVRTHTNA